jgi:hypothetical protein
VISSNHPALRSATAAIALVACLIANGLGSTGSASATGRLTTPFPLLHGISCSSRTLCVAVDNKGHAVSSTNPAAASPIWRGSEIPGLADPQAISCVATALCVTVSWNGGAGISTDPAADRPHWSAAVIGADLHFIDSVSCPSISMCVVVGGDGVVAISSDPTAAKPSWSVWKVDGSELLRSVSCPSRSLCVAVDGHGRAIVSNDPSGATPHWSAPDSIDAAPLSAISCPSASLCVAVDERGGTVRSTDPAGGAWSAPQASETTMALSSVSCEAALCVAVGKAPESAAVLSMDPTTAAPAWKRATSLGPPGPELPPSVSCAPDALCVAVSDVAAAVSANADVPTPTWTVSSEIDRLSPGSVRLRGPIAARDSTLRFSLGCQGAWVLQSCRGTATLSAIERLSASGRAIALATRRTKRTRTVTLGRMAFTMAASESGAELHTRQIKLNRTGRHLLARFKRLPVALSISALAPELRVPSRLVAITTARATFTAQR